MVEHRINFDDGAAYERMMGRWSRLAGDVFLEWLDVDTELRWVDVGCGNGAFTEAVIERCSPSATEGVDPSQGQLDFAQTRPGASLARFQQGNAMDLPYKDDAFDVAAMALVLFFVPEPAKGLAEMRRVVAPGGTVAAYTWDMLGGGFPLNALQEEIRAMGYNTPLPPSVEASRAAVMKDLWVSGGLVDIKVREITVERTFADFVDVWETSRLGASVGPVISSMTKGETETLKDRLKARLPAQSDGRITYSARANAVTGRVAK
jgi:ubiquinone/menaquinone biosynthesis C-methylase UbiE